MWRCEASHVHATSSEGLYPSAACGLPKAPSRHPVPLDGASWSLGAPLACPASWADRASGLLLEAVRAPIPVPGPVQAKPLQCTGVLLLSFAVSPGVGPLSGTSPSPVRGDWPGGIFKIKIVWGKVRGGTLQNLCFTTSARDVALVAMSFLRVDFWLGRMPNPLRPWGGGGVTSASFSRVDRQSLVLG